MQKQWQIFLQIAVTTRKKGLECGGAVKQETARRETTPGTTSLPANVTNWKMARPKRFFIFNDFSMKVMKRVGWEGGFSNFTPAVSTPVD